MSWRALRTIASWLSLSLQCASVSASEDALGILHSNLLPEIGRELVENHHNRWATSRLSILRIVLIAADQESIGELLEQA
jgi:hypothetical protein